MQSYNCRWSQYQYKNLKNTGIPLQRCINHGIHLVVTDLFYKEATNDVYFHFDEESALCESEELSDSANDEFDEYEQNQSDVCLLEIDFKILIRKVREVSYYFKNSAKGRRALKEYTVKATLVDSKTRWSSLHIMIKRFLEIFEQLQKASIDVKRDFTFTSNDRSTLNQMSAVLESPTDIVNMLSNSNLQPLI